MTPTREKLQVVAEWLGVSLLWMRGQPVPYVQMPLGRAKWQPHLPGIDNQRLMAALGEWGMTLTDGCLYSEYSGQFFYAQHDNTPDSKLQAIADAVWQCAVKVAMEAKR